MNTQKRSGLTIRDFRIGQIVLMSNKGSMVEAMVEKTNIKTISVRTVEGQVGWRCPPTLLFLKGADGKAVGSDVVKVVFKGVTLSGAKDKMKAFVNDHALVDALNDMIGAKVA